MIKKFIFVLLATLIFNITSATLTPAQADGKVDAASLEELLKKKKKS
jgi:dihydrodipicolinate synthase/N-acetylneuraminate lyase